MTKQTVLASIIEKLNDIKVLCIGDVILDSFVYGEVERISPEAPVPVLKITRREKMLGGSGNVVRNLDAIGASAMFFSVVGNDEPAKEISSLLSELSKTKQFLSVVENRKTSLKNRFVATGQQMLRTDEETTTSISNEQEASLVSLVKEKIKEVSVVILSDYGKGVLTPTMQSTLIAEANNLGKPVVIDPKGTDYSKYNGAYLITPNRKELAEATRMQVDSDEEIIVAARHLMDSFCIKNVLVTRGDKGMTLVASDEIHHLPAQAKEVFDVSGAGDTVVATMASSLGAGISIADSARIANAAGAIVVSKVGTAVVYADELISYLRNQDIVKNRGKVLSLEKAIERVLKLRAGGAKIGFTNGCFDLIHPGHVSLLSQAKEACDFLIVGLNSDTSVSDLKGSSRPVQPESSRAIVLSSLSSVDIVVIFSEETPVRLIKALKPDVLIKGADYTVETVVGADIVQSYGGKIVLAKLADGHSTTNTIKKLNQ